MNDIDKRLDKAGMLSLIENDDDEEDTEMSPNLRTNNSKPHSSKGENNIIREMARKKANKDQEKQINNALRMVSRAPLQLIVRSDYWKDGNDENDNYFFQKKNSEVSNDLLHPLKEDDINDAVKE
eukprot:5383552-Ditylum_brightwellii.AAC.1